MKKLSFEQALEAFILHDAKSRPPFPFYRKNTIDSLSVYIKKVAKEVFNHKRSFIWFNQSFYIGKGNYVHRHEDSDFVLIPQSLLERGVAPAILEITNAIRHNMLRDEESEYALYDVTNPVHMKVRENSELITINSSLDPDKVRQLCKLLQAFRVVIFKLDNA